MKKNFKYFGITWIVGLIIFNAITFLIPNRVLGITRFDKSVFWIAYVLITLSFFAQLLTAYKFIKADSNERKFLNIPLLRTGYAAIVVSVIVGLIFMIFPALPTWLGAIICLLISGCFIIACINTDIVANVVDDIGATAKNKAAFIRTATVEAENIMACAVSSEIKADCRKVYEALRYSDPMSNPALSDIEIEIDNCLKELKKAVSDDDATKVLTLTTNILLNIKERNGKCKLLK